MKSFISLKTCVVLCGMGAALLFAPGSKAQSEVSPDHFDGTDSWAAAHSQAAKPKQTPANVTLQAKAQKNSQGSSFQLASSREVTKAPRPNATAVDRKRKATTPNPEKK